MNTALSGHKCTSKIITDQEQDQAAYTIALLAKLLYWQYVKDYSGVTCTYRMCSVDSGIANVLEQYRKGPKVAFPAFMSSSSDRNITFDFAKPLPNEYILLVMPNLFLMKTSF